MTRKMATIQVVNGIYPIAGADRICQYGINGWRVVDQVGRYSVGDRVVFAEIDSWIPNSVAPFLTKPDHKPKEYLGVLGERLRTVKLRGALSQGLILPLSVMGEENYRDRSARGLENCWVQTQTDETGVFGTVGAMDVNGAEVGAYLGIFKWEPPAEFLNADTKGNFPHFIPKSDQARIQNVYEEMTPYFNSMTFEVQEKVEGQSHTVYYNDGVFGVCSRNLELKDGDNTFWNTTRKFNLESKLRSLGRNIAIQSEQTGAAISGNIYGMEGHTLYVFDIYDIDAQCYLNPDARRYLIEQLGLISAPVLHTGFTVGDMSLMDILHFADGKSVLGTTGTLREGLVFKANSDARISFKSISNEYLLKHKN